MAVCRGHLYWHGLTLISAWIGNPMPGKVWDGQWRGALMFSLICAWPNDWVSNRDAGDLRRAGCATDVLHSTKSINLLYIAIILPMFSSLKVTFYRANWNKNLLYQKWPTKTIFSSFHAEYKDIFLLCQILGWNVHYKERTRYVIKI